MTANDFHRELLQLKCRSRQFVKTDSGLHWINQADFDFYIKDDIIYIRETAGRANISSQTQTGFYYTPFCFIFLFNYFVCQK